MASQPVTTEVIDTVIFDCDDCLYARDVGIAEMVYSNILSYMREYLGIPEDQVAALCQSTYVSHGTTMAGLVDLGHKIDPDHWHAHVHGSVPVDELLKPDEGLRSMLLSLPQRDRLWVFTNADHRHAEACLRALGVRDLFQGVFHYESLQEEAARRNAGRILCKPQVDAFHAVLDLAGAAPHRTLFLDDSARNVQGASQAGLRAVQVGAPVPCAGALAAVVDIRHLTVVLPELWSLSEAPAEEAAAEAEEGAVKK